MTRINLNHWFVKDNNLSISLMRFHVEIKTKKSQNNIYYSLKVINSNREEQTLDFYTLEEAIAFTETIINKSENINEIINEYQKQNEEKEEYAKITLTKEEIDEAIISHFGSEKDFRVSCKEEVTLENGIPKVYFYLTEHDGRTVETPVLLTNGDLRNVFENYISFYGYELIDFKYIGGIHHVGYYFHEDTPHFDGIELSVKKKEKENKLTYKNNWKGS